MGGAPQHCMHLRKLPLLGLTSAHLWEWRLENPDKVAGQECFQGTLRLSTTWLDLHTNSRLDDRTTDRRFVNFPQYRPHDSLLSCGKNAHDFHFLFFHLVCAAIWTFTPLGRSSGTEARSICKTVHLLHDMQRDRNSSEIYRPGSKTYADVMLWSDR